MVSSSNSNFLNLNKRLISDLCVFAELDTVEFKVIMSAAREERFWHGQVIFYEGSRVHCVSMLLSGCVKCTQVGANGNEIILRLVGPGDIIGTLFGPAQSHSAQAIQKAVLLVWDVNVFEQLLEQFPTFGCNAMHAVEGILSEMEQRFWSASTQKIDSRLSSELLRLTNRWEGQSDSQRNIVLSHAELGQLTGMALSTISRLLRQWQTQGIVAIHRGAVTVQNSAALARIAFEAGDEEKHRIEDSRNGEPPLLTNPRSKKSQLSPPKL